MKRLCLTILYVVAAGAAACPSSDSPTAQEPQQDASASIDIQVVADSAAPPLDAAAQDVATVDASATDLSEVPTNPTGEVLTLQIEPFTVQPGKERQVCKTINVPGDAPIDLVKVVSQMQGTSHHFNIYKVIDGTKFDPVSAAEASVRNCSPADAQLAGDAAYIFGSATPERTFETPKGVAIQLEPGQRLILEQHVINFTPSVIEGGVQVELFNAADPEAIDHYADIMWFNNMGIFLPAGQETSLSATCSVPYDVNVIGIMSHFHELGVHFQVDRVADGQVQELVYEDDDWAHPKYQVYQQPPILLRKGDGLRWTCTWFNYRDNIVTFGPDSTNEMCITFALAYPTESKVGAPISCDVFL